jgi:hypothetical protein
MIVDGGPHEQRSFGLVLYYAYLFIYAMPFI